MKGKENNTHTLAQNHRELHNHFEKKKSLSPKFFPFFPSPTELTAITSEGQQINGGSSLTARQGRTRTTELVGEFLRLCHHSRKCHCLFVFLCLSFLYRFSYLLTLIYCRRSPVMTLATLNPRRNKDSITRTVLFSCSSAV